MNQTLEQGLEAYEAMVAAFYDKTGTDAELTKEFREEVKKWKKLKDCGTNTQTRQSY